MKNNNILTVVLTLIVGISIGIFGLSVYQTMNSDKNNQEENVNNNQELENSQNGEEQNNTVTSVDFKKVKELFERIIIPDTVASSFVRMFYDVPNKKIWSVDEMSTTYLVEIMRESNKLEKVEICDTEFEKELIQKGVISVKYTGQWTCKTGMFYTIDSIKKVSKEIFGKELPQFTKITTDINSSYYYYEKANIGIFFFAGADSNSSTIENYYIKNNVLSIEFNSNVTEENYKLNFKIEGENFYFESIEKLS